jgi:hypothetical protein
MADPTQHPSGHVFRVERVRGPVWYAKYRLPDGRQVQRKVPDGPGPPRIRSARAIEYAIGLRPRPTDGADDHAEQSEFRAGGLIRGAPDC